MLTIELTIKAIKIGIELAYDVIDFVDMLYMPLLRNVRFWQVDRLLVDEAQDLNVLQRMAAKKMLAVGGRACFVGDPNQAIYGFTGADSESLNSIKAEFNAKELPLTITYRCPKAVVAVAQEWVNHIQAADTAPEGTIKEATYKDFLAAAKDLQPTDAIICRKVAPVVELAYSLIGRKIACHVEGREIGAGLISLTKKWKSVRTVEALLNKLEDYRAKQVDKLMMIGREQSAAALTDKVETINVIAANLPLDADVRDLEAAIKEIFADNAQNLTLSTIHKAKGREWSTVYWLGSESYQPSKFARQAWQLQQEHNLMYVAATRSKDTLVFVQAKPKD